MKLHMELNEVTLELINLLSSQRNQSGRDAFILIHKQMERPSTVNQNILLKEFFNMKYNGNFRKHLPKLGAMQSEIRNANNGLSISEAQFWATALNSLPEEYDSTVNSLAGETDFNKIMHIILDRELKIKSKPAKEKEKINLAAIRKPNLKKKEHKTPYNKTVMVNGPKGKKELKGRDISKVCSICDCYGHDDNSCFRNRAGTSKEKAQAAKLNKNNWNYDSGASSHMSCNQNFFVNFKQERRMIELADGKQIHSLGIGNILLSLRGGEKPNILELKDVLLAPQLTTNLISISKLQIENLKIIFEKNTIKIFDQSNEKITESYIDQNLYPLNGEVILPSLETSLLVSDKNNFKFRTLHNQLGHPNINKMKIIIKANGLNLDIPTEFHCESCNYGKMSRFKFERSKNRSENPIEILQVDIMGPIETRDINNNIYRLNIVDNFSRFEWNYLLKFKSQACDIIINHIKALENEISKPHLIYRVKILRSDNGTEFLNNKLEQFLQNKGIKSETTVKYTPQQNGVAERKNRTITECARTILHNAKLPKYFWGPAIDTATYLTNRVPTSANSGISPYEKLYGRKPEISHLKTFGC